MKPMNRKAVTAIVVILVLAVGMYGAYRVYKHFKRLSTPIAVQTTTPSSMANLKDLLANGTAQMCTFTEGDTHGTLYISGGKVRDDFESTENGKTVKSHIIDMNNTSYIWSDGQSTGIKSSFNPNASPLPTSGSLSAGSSGTLDANANMNYRCGAWTPDQSQFILPTGVTFSSFAMPTNIKPESSPSSGSSSQCSYCDSLTGNGKTQCLTALKCN